MIDPISFAVIGGAIAVITTIGFFTDADRRLKRKLKKAPRRSIRHLPDGAYARFVGKVTPFEQPLEGPLTGRRCAYWRVIVLEKRGKSYSEVLRREQGQDFSIRDDSGTMLVRVAGAKLAMEVDGNTSSGVWSDPTPALERFLAHHGEKTTGWLFNRTLRCSEAVIEEGESVTIAGVARAEPDPDAQRQATGYRETPMRMVIAGGKDKDACVLITDDPAVARKRD